jgi:hypothetical protein
MPETQAEEAVEGKVTDNLPANIKDEKGALARSQDFERFITSKAEEMRDDDSDPLQRIIAQVLNAETPDAVLTPVEVLKASDIVGEPVFVLAFSLQKSEYDVGSPFYAVIDVVRGPNQPPEVVTCGHKKVMAQLVRLQELNAFPFAAEFIERGKSNIGGTAMLELRKVDIKTDEAPF